jgi:hypothetical protein
MLHFGVTITPVLNKRLAIFNNSIESCTIHASQERLELYPRSLNKFVTEWNWALGHRNDTGSINPEPEAWAKYLLEQGIDLEARNGPIENKNVIIEALTENRIVICDIWIPSTDFPDSKCKHYVLIAGLANGKLFIHDPLPANRNIQFDSEKVEYNKNACGTNFEIDCDYFFNEEINYMKPKSSLQRSDCDYSFLILSRS